MLIPFLLQDMKRQVFIGLCYDCIESFKFLIGEKQQHSARFQVHI